MSQERQLRLAVQQGRPDSRHWSGTEVLTAGGTQCSRAHCLLSRGHAEKASWVDCLAVFLEFLVACPFADQDRVCPWVACASSVASV